MRIKRIKRKAEKAQPRQLPLFEGVEVTKEYVPPLRLKATPKAVPYDFEAAQKRTRYKVHPCAPDCKCHGHRDD